MSNSRDLLAQLVRFDTTSRESNLALIDFVRTYLQGHGVACELVFNAQKSKANLLATLGPAGVPGIVLSGHTDVVPVDGQRWTVAPFDLTEKDGKLYGRGTADMKGYIACVLACVPALVQAPLRMPVHIALSYDEEVGCLGVRSLIERFHAQPVKPLLCVIGEPTELKPVLGHKGKGSYRTYCRGLEAHSSLAPRSVNAIHVACDFIGALRESQQQLQRHGAQDNDYDVPYSTVHVGQIIGGKALNIVPNLCTLDFEVRNLPADDLEQFLEQMRERAEVIVREAQKLSSVSAIEIETVNVYPGLDTHPSVEAVRFLKQFAAPGTGTSKVSFGTEGGLFKQRLDVPVVVCGPGSIEQAHKPDEFIEISQMDAGERFLQGLLGSLTA